MQVKCWGWCTYPTLDTSIKKLATSEGERWATFKKVNLYCYVTHL